MPGCTTRRGWPTPFNVDAASGEGTMTTTRKRILSGVQPSGKLHLGNYFGAVKQHIALQDEADCFYFIADYHTLTSIRDTAERAGGKPAALLRDYSRDVALDYLALGLDPD